MQVVTTGVVFRPQSPPERLREVVEAADAAGVGELWLWEDCFWEGGLTAAAAALAWSERLRIGIGLLPVALRNPAVVAMEIATLARLFPDRFVPGLGHGVLDWMGQVGARAESPMTLLREHTAAVRDLLHGHRVDVGGRYVHLDGVALEWPPAQPPPLLLGARGPKTLRLAGESADGVILDAAATPDDVRAACVEVEAGRAVAGTYRSISGRGVQRATRGPGRRRTGRRRREGGARPGRGGRHERGVPGQCRGAGPRSVAPGHRDVGPAPGTGDRG
jgi:alkanesulfonate monooxygenase SsuD/methylene tetrahydromethanopterin reductase-like flavin-dependent oxidoreductase (luciferase family)